MGNNKNPNQKRPGEKGAWNVLHYNPGNMSGKTNEKETGLSNWQKNRTETKANRPTNRAPKVRLPVSFEIRLPSPTSKCVASPQTGGSTGHDDNRTLSSRAIAVFIGCHLRH